MKIVTIRGTGLIGSKTAAILREGGHEVRILREDHVDTDETELPIPFGN